MKMQTLIASLIVMLGIVGCSKDGKPSVKQQRLVPSTVAELEASPDFKLDHTTKGGIKFYVRDISSEVADSIDADSRDSRFLDGGRTPQLFAVVYKGDVVSYDSLDAMIFGADSVFPEDEAKDVIRYIVKREMEDIIADQKEMQREAAQ